MTKQLHTARAATMGLEAAVLAADGLSGPREILEGALGVFAGLAPDAVPGRVLAEPDAPWLLHATSFKPWAACRHCHATIDAALALRRWVAGRSIRAITVAAYGDAIAFCDRAQPQSVIEAKFSLQHAAAVTLLKGPPPLDAFLPAGFDDEAVACLRRRVTLHRDEGFTAAYPSRFGSAVTVSLEDGEVRSASVPDALGDPENPLTPQAIIGKARTLMASAAVTPARIEAVIAAVLALPDGAPAAALNDALP